MKINESYNYLIISALSSPLLMNGNHSIQVKSESLI